MELITIFYYLLTYPIFSTLACDFLKHRHQVSCFYFIFPTSLWLTSKESFAIKATLLWLDNKLIHLTANVSYPGASVSPLPI